MTQFMFAFSNRIQKIFLLAKNSQNQPYFSTTVMKNLQSHRNMRGKLQYLIKWKSYTDHENTREKQKTTKTGIRFSKSTTRRDDALQGGRDVVTSLRRSQMLPYIRP